MKFLDLNSNSPTAGYSFDGLWKEGQTKGYIFWFPNEQSIDITYTMPICILTECNADDIDSDMSVPALTLTIEDNEIFSFITHDNETTVDGYTFNKPIYTHIITTVPEKVGNYYAHVFNVACHSNDAGEYICRINIGNEGYIRVGADFYGEYEPAYINLSNMGVEIPELVQKAIYDSNVHEDFKDNILINRKFKELLSNYWDIIANKGSYRSLKNSLEWFEWGDTLKLREIWKHNDCGRTIFSDKEILSVFDNKLVDYLQNFVKTTYVSLYCTMQDETTTYDAEKNPELTKAVFKWSREDLQTKLSLLAQFFGSYFLPIHMSVLHATIEDKVFTNTIKQLHGAEVKRDDCFGDFNYVECNIKDNDVYKLTNVSTQVTSDTVFGVNYSDDQETTTFGVDECPKNSMITESNIRTFASQYYTGPGAIIPIKLIIPNQNLGDFVKKTIIDYTTTDGTSKRLFFNNVFRSYAGKVKINFNFLAKTAQAYEIKFTFIFASSKTVTRLIKFNVEDVDNLNINIYKIRSKNDAYGFTIDDFKDTSMNKYLFSIQKTTDKSDIKHLYHQYLPYMPYLNTDTNVYAQYKGIKLNRTVVYDLNSLTDDNYDAIVNEIITALSNDFLIFSRKHIDANKNITNKISYLVCVSKKFNLSSETLITHSDLIIRDSYGFYPQFHYLEKMDGTNIDNYTINQYEAICCAAEINNGAEVVDFKYGRSINDVEWSFFNHITNETINHPASSQQPFAVKSNNKIMNDGYYDITFKYSLTNGIEHECRLQSGFRIKSI